MLHISPVISYDISEVACVCVCVCVCLCVCVCVRMHICVQTPGFWMHLRLHKRRGLSLRNPQYFVMKAERLVSLVTLLILGQK